MYTQPTIKLEGWRQKIRDIATATAGHEGSFLSDEWVRILLRGEVD